VAGAIAATSFAGDLGLAVTTMCSFVVLGTAAALLGPETRDRYRRQPALSATPVVSTD